MSYILEKKTLSGFNFHPTNSFELWENIGESLSESDLIKKATNFARIDGGTYRVKEAGYANVVFKVEGK